MYDLCLTRTDAVWQLLYYSSFHQFFVRNWIIFERKLYSNYHFTFFIVNKTIFQNELLVSPSCCCCCCFHLFALLYHLINRGESEAKVDYANWIFTLFFQFVFSCRRDGLDRRRKTPLCYFIKLLTHFAESLADGFSFFCPQRHQSSPFVSWG